MNDVSGHKKNSLQKVVKTFRQYSGSRKVAIYQMGKVGSTALEDALPEAIRFHTLYNRSPCEILARMERPGIVGQLKLRGIFLSHRVLLRTVRDLRIISIVRDPIDRNISMFFQDLPFWLAKHISNTPPQQRKMDQQLLLDAYVHAFNHNYCVTWIDREIGKFTGIDIYKVPFNQERGYTLYEKDKIKLLLLRYEDLSQMLPVIESFVERPFALSQINVGSNKWYSGLYRSFQSLKIDIEKLPCSLQLRNTPFAKHFGYTSRESS